MILHSLLDYRCSYSMYVKSLIGANVLRNSEIIISAGKETERLEEICRTSHKFAFTNGNHLSLILSWK